MEELQALFSPSSLYADHRSLVEVSLHHDEVHADQVSMSVSVEVLKMVRQVVQVVGLVWVSSFGLREKCGEEELLLLEHQGQMEHV